jgi:CheY-like chemotaxis protein/HPt (histidine-containing phosphotransfer) domain-containing protein
VDTAVNGLQALECFDEHHYDVVLMDIQMPGMDGVTAARQMHSHPDPTRARTPVVALTAHALPGEAARARQAGFVGYVSKPFQEEKLLAVLQQALAGPTAAAPAAYPPVAAEPLVAAEPPPLDLSPLRRLAGNDPGFLRKLAELFVRTTPPTLEKLRQHLDEQNWSALAADAHFLKSSVGGIGLQALLPGLRQLEAADQRGTTPDPEQLRPLVEQICGVFAQAVDQMRREYLAD